MAAPVDLGITQAVDELQRVLGHLLDRIGDLRQRAAPGAAMIVNDYREVFGELGNIVGPKPSVAAQAGNQEQRRPLPWVS